MTVWKEDNFVVWEKYLITEDYRKASIELLIGNLAALCARLNITQEELTNVIGTSRQTFYSIETGKREMSWPIYMAIIFFFDSIPDTSEMMKELRIYPIDLIMRFNDELESPWNAVNRICRWKWQVKDEQTKVHQTNAERTAGRVMVKTIFPEADNKQ